MARRYLLLLCVCIAVGCGERDPGPEIASDLAPETTRDSEAATRTPEYGVPSLVGYDAVIVTVDGLRADRLNSETMPFLSDSASEGLRFTNAAANSSQVLQSLASFETGRLPTAGGTIGVYEAEPHDETRTLAQYFSDAGYYTGLLANQPAIQGAGFTKGFEEIQLARAGEPLDDARLVKRATEFLEDAGDDRVFLHVHLAGVLVSALYAPESADGPINPVAFAADYATRFPPDAGRVEATKSAYDDAMRAADGRIREIVEAVRAAGRGDKTLFVITSLTGYELLEHGSLGTGWTVYDESIRVPLVMSAGDALRGAAIDVPVGLVDVTPSILALTGLGDDSPREGEPVFAPDGEGLKFVAPAGPRIAEVVIPERCIVRSVTDGGYAYIASSLWPETAARYGIAQAHKETANAFADGSKPLPPLWGHEAFEALFDLGGDPGEQDNVHGAKGDVGVRLRAELDDYQAHCTANGIPPRVATQFESAVDAEQLQNLESLGYL